LEDDAIPEFDYRVCLAPLLSLAVNVVAQVVALKATRGRFLRSVALGAAAGEVFFLALTLPNLQSGQGLPYILVVQPAYIAGALCYFAFASMNASSLRIRMLEELRAAGGKAPQSRILGSHDGRAVRLGRIERLVHSGILVKDGDFYRSGKTPLLHVAHGLDMLRRFLLGK
jgi:hypothetical protein